MWHTDPRSLPKAQPNPSNSRNLAPTVLSRSKKLAEFGNLMDLGMLFAIQIMGTFGVLAVHTSSRV